MAEASGVVTITEPTEESSAEAEISAASFRTRNVLRDPQVRSRIFLDTRRHPVISFRSTTVQFGHDAWTVSGILTVKGQPAPLSLTITEMTAKGSALVFRAIGTVDRYAHGITMMRGMAARYLSVEITAQATRI
jgi:polyisoprenoid-binding protein YceI